MGQDGGQDWRELCQAAANEQDSKKLIDLIAQITRALDERDRGQKVAAKNQKVDSQMSRQ